MWASVRLRGSSYRRVRQDAAACAAGIDHHVVEREHASFRQTDDRDSRDGLEPSGTPVQNGTTVTFTTNLGTLSPVEARTLNGVATVQFLGNGQSGKATIKALSGGAASEALELSVGAGAAGRVSVTANPASVPASRRNDDDLPPLFSTRRAIPFPECLSTFQHDGGLVQRVVVNSDAAGTRVTTLTTNRELRRVTATAGRHDFCAGDDHGFCAPDRDDYGSGAARRLLKAA